MNINKICVVVGALWAVSFLAFMGVLISLPFFFIDGWDAPVPRWFDTWGMFEFSLLFILFIIYAAIYGVRFLKEIWSDL